MSQRLRRRLLLPTVQGRRLPGVVFGTVVVGAMACAPPLFAQDTEWNRYTLEGLPGVYLSAEVDAGCESLGVSPDRVLAAAQTALADEPVRQLTQEAMLETPGLPDLRIAAYCAPGDDTAFAVSVRLHQAARMVRNEQITLSEAVTWHTTRVGSAGDGPSGPAINRSIAEAVRAFIAAYLEANPTETDGG